MANFKKNTRGIYTVSEYVKFPDGSSKRIRVVTKQTKLADAKLWYANYKELLLLKFKDEIKGTTFGSLTIDQAFGEYIASRQKNSDTAHSVETDRYNFKTILRFIPDDTLVSAINTHMVLNKFTNKRKLETRKVKDRTKDKVKQTGQKGRIYYDYPLVDKYISHATIKRELKKLKAVLNFCRNVLEIEAGDFLMSEQALDEVPDRTEGLRDEVDLKNFMETVVEHAKNPALFTFLTGARPINGRKLEWHHLDFERDTIKLVGIKDPNTKSRNLTIPMHPELKKIFIELGPKKNGKVFLYGGKCKCSFCKQPKNNGKPIGILRKSIRSALTEIGLPETRFYDLKHTCATWLFKNGVDIYRIAALLGHKDIRTTKKYIQNDVEDLRDSVNCLPTHSKE